MFLLVGVTTLNFAMVICRKLSSGGLVSTAAAYSFFNIGNVNIISTMNSIILVQLTILFSVILPHFTYKNDKMISMKAVALSTRFAGLMKLRNNAFISDVTKGIYTTIIKKSGNE